MNVKKFNAVWWLLLKISLCWGHIKISRVSGTPCDEKWTGPKFNLSQLPDEWLQPMRAHSVTWSGNKYTRVSSFISLIILLQLWHRLEWVSDPSEELPLTSYVSHPFPTISWKRLSYLSEPSRMSCGCLKDRQIVGMKMKQYSYQLLIFELQIWSWGIK